MQIVTFILSDWDFEGIDLSINQLINDCDIDIDCTFTWHSQFLPRIGELVDLNSIITMFMKNDKDNEKLRRWVDSVKSIARGKLFLYLSDCRVEKIVHYGDEILIYLTQPDW